MQELGIELRGGRSEELEVATIEGDEVLGDGAALGLVGVEERWGNVILEDETELPPEVVSVLDGRVHALASFGGVGVWDT